MLSSWADRDSFGKELNKVLSPARPIQSVEHLRGREKELLRIEKALFAHGRHIFIYGDRGIGKSSVAAAAAAQIQSSDSPYIDVSCSTDSTFRSVIANIGYQASRQSRLRKSKKTSSVAFEYPARSCARRQEVVVTSHLQSRRVYTLVVCEILKLKYIRTIRETDLTGLVMLAIKPPAPPRRQA